MGRGILFNPRSNLRGWDNTRISAADYASSLTVYERIEGLSSDGCFTLSWSAFRGRDCAG